MANSVVQTIRDAEIDARSLSEFIYSPADAMISRRLAPSIHSLQYYLDFLDTIPNIVQNAIDNTVIDNGVVTDSLVVATPQYVGASARTQASKNSEYVTIFDFFTKSEKAAFDASYQDFDAAPVLQRALDAVGIGGILHVPLNHDQVICIKSTITLERKHSSLTIKGSKGTASRGSSTPTFRWTGAENGGIMFDILQSWGITFENCSLDGKDKATNLVRIRADGDGLSAKPSHRFSFIRCGFASAYNQLVVIGDGGNEDLVNITFDTCQFDYVYNPTENATAGILIDAPQGYGYDFKNCLFTRAAYPVNFFHIRAGSVCITDATFDGRADSVDIFVDPYNGAISPQITVIHAESQSGWFLKSSSNTVATRQVLLQNVRHRADNGQAKPMSVFWDLGGQSQLIHIGCAFHGIEIGNNAASVVDIGSQWGRTGGIYPITGYEGNTAVLTGLNGFNITESNRTIKGGIRVGDNFFSPCPADTNGNPKNFTGNKIDGDSWLNTSASELKSGVALHQYVDGRLTYMGDSMVHNRFTLSSTPNASKFNYLLDFNVTPQLNSIYEIRWVCKTSNSPIEYNGGVLHVFVLSGATASIKQSTVTSTLQSETDINIDATMFNGASESKVTSASQAALDGFKLRIKINNIVFNDLLTNQVKVSIRKITH